MSRVDGTSEPAALVLVVEDDQTVQRVVVRVLKQFGYRTESAMDGLEAVAAHAGKNFDAILMDCQMPTMDGFQATKAIRRAESTTGSHTPIIALTAMHTAREKCLESGMDDYLAKPVNPAELGETLRRAISRARLRGRDGRS